MDTVLSRALRQFISGPLNQLLVNLGGEDGVEWEKALKRFLRRENPWEAPPPKSLFEPFGTVAIPAAAEPFVVSDRFVVGTGRGVAVKVSFVGDNFRRLFGEMTAAAGPEQLLRYAKLLRRSVDEPIIAELGGEEAVETSLSIFWALIERQPNGERGPLLTDGCANVFYVRDARNVLWAVYVLWSSDGWDVDANEVADPHPWGGGSQVFSRDPQISAT